MKTNIYKLAIALLVFFKCNVVCNAQIFGNNQFDVKPPQYNTDKEDTTHNERIISVNESFGGTLTTDIAQSAMAVKKDSAYYANIVKKNGWWIGIGERLTMEQASHLSCYYKLSKNNSVGNWTYIEAFDGTGEPTTNHSIVTYLVNQFDDYDQGANKEWKDKLSEICKWEFVGDATGEQVIQERGLDDKGNVVYIYSPVKVGDNEYTGSYVDSWGMPVFLRTDSLGNDAGYANVVHITRDERGYEVLLTYTDRFGFPQKNKDGAYGTRMEYDDDGNQISEASLNLVGDRMVDDWGNCGWKYEYENGLRLKAECRDAQWRPMIMPNKRVKGERVYGWTYKYDKWGRETERMAIDADGNPDTEKTYGYNKVVMQYDEYGNRTRLAYYDLDGNLAQSDGSVVAQIDAEFSPNGKHMISAEYKDADGKYVNYDNEYCKIFLEFNDDYSILMSRKDYVSNADSLEISYEYHNDGFGNESRIWYQDDKQRIDSVDSKGRETLCAYYDLNNSPKGEGSWYRRATMYIDLDGEEIQVESLIDDENNAYQRRYFFTDSIKHVRTYSKEYRGYEVESYVQELTPDLKKILRQWDITPYEEHARVGTWNNLYYTCDVDYTMYGKIRTMVGRNEFDEPSYLTPLWDGGEVYYYSSLNQNGNRIYFDEFGNEIPMYEMETFKKNLPKAYCIEVTDTAIAYPLNIRNGDIIISYGNWMTNEDLNTDLDYFYLETILQAKKSKQVTLLRHNIEEKTSEIVKVELPEGRTSDLGFYPHRICYTQREKQRLLDTSKAYGLVFNNETMPKDTTILMAVQIKGEFYQTFLYHLPFFEIKDAGLILCAERYSGSWYLTHNEASEWYSQDMLDTKGSTTTTILMTQNMTTSRVFNKSKLDNGGMIVTPIQVSMDVYEQLLSCYSNCSDAVQEVEDKGKEQGQEFLLLATVDGDEGLFMEKNLTGQYIVLELCNWDCTQSFDDFNTEYIKQQGHAKKLTLLPIEDNGVPRPDKILYIKSKDSLMGLGMQDFEVSSELKEMINQIYEEWKTEKHKPQKW